MGILRGWQDIGQRIIICLLGAQGIEDDVLVGLRGGEGGQG